MQKFQGKIKTESIRSEFGKSGRKGRLEKGWAGLKTFSEPPRMQVKEKPKGSPKTTRQERGRARASQAPRE